VALAVMKSPASLAIGTALVAAASAAACTRYGTAETPSGDAGIEAGPDAQPDAPAPTTGPLLGSLVQTPTRDTMPVSEAHVFAAQATGTGVATTITVLLGAAGPETAFVGIYDSDAQGNAHALLGQGTLTGVSDVTWRTTKLDTPVPIQAGNDYWIVLLAPPPGGSLILYDTPNGGQSYNYAVMQVSTLPSTWHNGIVHANAPLSAYASP
jgi:hypothetical protein